MRRFLLIAICLLGATAVFGQFTSTLGRFQVDQVKGCAPFTITITDISGLCTGTCIMDPGDGRAPSTNQFNFTYTTPGVYRLAILYQSLTPPTDDITITVVENGDPTFEIYTCTDNRVTVKVTDKAFDTYFIDFDGDGTTDTTVPMGNNATGEFDYTTLFPAPHTYNIGVRGKNLNAADNCKTLSEAFTTIAPGTPILPTRISELTALDANTVSIGLQTTDHFLYKLEIAPNGSGAFQFVKDIYETDSTGMTSLLLDQNFYCFRLNAIDPCEATAAPSAVICTQDLDVAFTNGSNQLRWATDGAISNFNIRRNTNPLYVQNLAGGARLYDDNDYECNQEFCYQLVSFAPDGSTSTSLLKCGTGILQTTFPAINNVTSVVRAGVDLTWEADATLNITTFDIFKALPGTPLTPFRTSSTEVFIDETYNVSGGTCYQVNYGDNCGNRSAPGVIACPMALSGTVDEKNAITLGWSSYKGYQNGVAGYVVNKYDKNSVLLGQYPTTDTTFIDTDATDNEQIVIYRIVANATDLGPDKSSYSNVVTIERPARLILPNAFTPNGDGINPTFTIAGKYVSKISLQIFDRWGVLVYSSEKNEPWDGTRAGKPMPESAYVWKAEVEDFAGNSFTQQGTIILLRPGN